MRQLILVISITTSLALTSCGYFLGKTVSEEIPDITKPWKKVISVKLDSGKYVHRVKVAVSGHSNGKFSINGKEFSPGDIDKVVRDGDYYSSDFLISYEPLEVNEGQLKVFVTFYYTD